MTHLAPIEAFELFRALSLHFSGSYDFFKYHGKVKKVDPEYFLGHKDRLKYTKLARLYPEDELVGFIVSNALEKKKLWIGNLMDSNAKETYSKWKSRQESLTYRFQQEWRHLLDISENPFKFGEGYPPAVTEYLGNEISLETLSILEAAFKFLEKSPKTKDDIILEPLLLKIKKYLPFLVFDPYKIKKILVET